MTVLLIFFYTHHLQAQKENAIKEHPIIFLEGFVGISVISEAGVAGGFEVNYQRKSNLFSFRITEIAGYKKDSLAYLFPSYTRAKYDNEYALLYGKRWLQNTHSFSLSGGVSYNRFILDEMSFSTNYVGLPLEANIIWYYSKRKKAFRYCFVPKVGVKLFGSISKNSFIGIGVSLGFGYHIK